MEITESQLLALVHGFYEVVVTSARMITPILPHKYGLVTGQTTKQLVTFILINIDSTAFRSGIVEEIVLQTVVNTQETDRRGRSWNVQLYPVVLGGIPCHMCCGDSGQCVGSVLDPCAHCENNLFSQD